MYIGYSLRSSFCFAESPLHSSVSLEKGKLLGPDFECIANNGFPSAGYRLTKISCPLFRLEKFAQEIESEYERFDTWRDRCDNMNQWLIESERLIKNEEKVGSDIDVLQEQIKDNQVGAKTIFLPPRTLNRPFPSLF